MIETLLVIWGAAATTLAVLNWLEIRMWRRIAADLSLELNRTLSRALEGDFGDFND